MADEPIEVEDEKSDDSESKLAKHDAGHAAALEKVTDYVEEAEISSQNIGDAMKVVNDRNAQEADARQAKEKELSKVKISKDDVDLIVNEMEISKHKAETMLREHKGNVVEALTALTN